MVYKTLQTSITLFIVLFSLSANAVLELTPIRDIWTTSVYAYDVENHFSGCGGGRDDEDLHVGGWGDYYHSLLLFDMSGIEQPAVSATLRLYNHVDESNTSYTVSMHLDRVTSDWDWTTNPLGDCTLDNERLWWVDRPSYVPYASWLPAPLRPGYWEADVTDLVNGHITGLYENHGIQLRPISVSNEFNVFASSVHPSVEWRPRLILDVSAVPPCNTPIDCARAAISAPYAWGLEGYDVLGGRWVDPLDVIQAAYLEPNDDMGPGLDCSGLVEWSRGLAWDLPYVRRTSRELCSVAHSDPVAEGELQPGDIMCFDYCAPLTINEECPTPSDGVIDHISLYAGFDVAGNETFIESVFGFGVQGVEEFDIGEINNSPTRLSALHLQNPSACPDCGYRRLKTTAGIPAIAFQSQSPITLKVTDPDGITIDRNTVYRTASEEAIAVPDILYYTFIDGVHDTVYSPILKQGSYVVKVIPKEDATLSDTYSLKVVVEGIETMLADQVSVDGIPSEGYGVSMDGSTVTPFVPTPAVDIHKLTDGNQADGANDFDVPRITAGEVVTWAYQVVNTGNVGIAEADLLVSDSQQGLAPMLDANSDDGDMILSPAEDWVYTASSQAVDLTSPPAGVIVVPGCNNDRSTYQNTGRATIAGANFFAEDLSHYCNPDPFDVDSDGDGVFDHSDNCTTVLNGTRVPDSGGNIQRDTDGDGYGNVCDADLNGDLQTDLSDFSLFRIALSTTQDPDADFDGDGIVDLTDFSLFRVMFESPPGPSGLNP